jgi:hypothetical protein
VNVPSLGPQELIIVLFYLVLSAIPLAVAIVIALLVARFLFGFDVAGRFGSRARRSRPSIPTRRPGSPGPRRVTVNRRDRQPRV